MDSTRFSPNFRVLLKILDPKSRVQMYSNVECLTRQFKKFSRLDTRLDFCRGGVAISKLAHGCPGNSRGEFTCWEAENLRTEDRKGPNSFWVSRTPILKMEVQDQLENVLTEAGFLNTKVATL